MSYETLQQAHSALTLAAAEFYRRILEPYEDGKIGANGDVYGAWLLAWCQKSGAKKS